MSPESWPLVILVLGVNLSLWTVVGLLRLTTHFFGYAYRVARRAHTLWRLVTRLRTNRQMARAERRRIWAKRPALARVIGRAKTGPSIADVAVLIPAHNEELVITDSLAAIIALVGPDRVHVVSDGSTDRTVELATEMGVNVISTSVNKGKAGALEEAIRRFDLVRRFRLVMLLDADTRVDPGYFAAALPMFIDPRVAAVAGCVRTDVAGRGLGPIGQFLVCHRQRIYAISQRFLKYGQTWSRLNATHIVPGFASVYRSDVLPKMDMNPPGLVIEDFNMTFELYQKKLGIVAFTTDAVAVTQDPDTFGDYFRQTRRWALGLWQTVRRHPPRFTLFSAMVLAMLTEQVLASLLFVVLPLVVLAQAVPAIFPVLMDWPPVALVANGLDARLPLMALLFAVVLPDVVLTVVAAVLERRPRVLLFAPFFLFLRVADAFISLQAMVLAWRTKSDGRWRSPTRRVEGGRESPPDRHTEKASDGTTPVSLAKKTDSEKVMTNPEATSGRTPESIG